MPRIPQDEIDRLKRDISLVRLAEAAGVVLKRAGKDFLGRCCFHRDRTPSLSIDPLANLWHCFGACDVKGGDVFSWMMRLRKVSFRHAFEILRADLPDLLSTASQNPGKLSTVRLLPCAVERTATDLVMIGQVAGHYTRHLPASSGALAYLQKRGLSHPEMLAHFQLGACDRTLGLTIPEKNRKDGNEIRERLGKLGLINTKTGHELYRGMITIPTFDEHGQVVGLYGRRTVDNIPKEERHRNLSGPLAGLINRAALTASDEIILCEAPLDALTFWCAGYRNVTCSFGTNGFTDAHRAAFKRHGTRRVIFAYDRDEAGDAGVAALAPELAALGIATYRILFPHGMDANDYASKVTPAAKILGIAIRKAEWLGNGSAPDRKPGAAFATADALSAEAPAPAATPTPEAAPALAADSRMAAELPGQLPLFAAELPRELPQNASTAECASSAARSEATVLSEGETLAVSTAASAPTAEPVTTIADAKALKTPSHPLTPQGSPFPEQPPPLATPVPPAPKAELPCQVTGDSVTLTRDIRTYKVRGLAKNTSFDILRVNVTARSEAGFHVDTLDLLQHRQRLTFAKAAALELGTAEATIHHDLGALLMALQDLQEECIKKALEPTVAIPEMSQAERADSLALLSDPQLVSRIQADYRAFGVVGEEVNTIVGHLATISRKQDKPLAVVLQSTSAAGKSTVMDAVCNFVPPEDQHKFSAMTGQALFYMGETNLAHKVLAIVEEEGAERASYALKLLQSEGELSIASTGKDPGTGRHVTHHYSVQGPVMIFLTTTASDLDDELQNRCLILTVNEDREQTLAIQKAQREARTPEGLLAAKKRHAIRTRHQNAQRLLRPIAVANPFARQLDFRSDKTRTRRDQPKYLALMDAITFLHQYQRPIRTLEEDGQTVTYIETTKEDVLLANQLARIVLGHSLDELAPQTRKLLSLVDAMAASDCERQGCRRAEYRFTRRQLREHTGWGNTQLKIHLARLEDLEYLVTHRSGHGLCFSYELVYDGAATGGERFLPGLIDPDTLPNPAGTIGNRSGPEAGWSGPDASRSGPGRPPVGGVSGGGRDSQEPLPEPHLDGNPEKSSKNASQGGGGQIVPYPKSETRPTPPSRAARAGLSSVPREPGNGAKKKVG